MGKTVQQSLDLDYASIRPKLYGSFAKTWKKRAEGSGVGCKKMCDTAPAESVVTVI